MHRSLRAPGRGPGGRKTHAAPRVTLGWHPSWKIPGLVLGRCDVDRARRGAVCSLEAACNTPRRGIRYLQGGSVSLNTGRSLHADARKASAPRSGRTPIDACDAVRSWKSAHSCSEHERARHAQVNAAPRVTPSAIHPGKPRQARRKTQNAEMNEDSSGACDSTRRSPNAH